MLWIYIFVNKQKMTYRYALIYLFAYLFVSSFVFHFIHTQRYYYFTKKQFNF